MTPFASAQGLTAALVAGYLAFLARQLARRNQTGQGFDGVSAQAWTAVGAAPETVARDVRECAPGLAWQRCTPGAVPAATAWLRGQRFRRAVLFLEAHAIAEDPAGLQGLAAAGPADLWLLARIAPTGDPNRHGSPPAERAVLESLRAVFPPAGIHPTGLRLLPPDGAHFLLAFASADRNARGRAMGLKAAEFLIQGARRAIPPIPPCRSPPAQ